MKILILNDGSKYQNWGIKACIDGLREILKDVIDDNEVDTLSHGFMHKIFFFEPKFFGIKIFNDNSRVANRIIPKFHVLPKIADEFEYISELWLSGHGGVGANIFLEKIKEVDVVIFNAEGSTYKNNIGAIKGLFMLWLAKTKFNKKSLFVNGSVTLTNVDPILPAMIRKVFTEIDFISVREPYSFNNIINFYPELKDKILMFPDSVFALDVKSTQSSVFEILPKKYFVFSRSMLPMDFNINENKSSVIYLIKSLKKIIPDVVFLAKDSEDQVLKEIAEKTDGIFIGQEFSYQDIFTIFKNASFLISGRYHHLIFATKVGCPIIPMITSSHKIHGLSVLFDNISPSVVDPTDLLNEGGKIIKSVEYIISQGDILRSKYMDKANDLKKLTLKQVKLISEIIS